MIPEAGLSPRFTTPSMLTTPAVRNTVRSSEAAAVAKSGALWIVDSYLGAQHRPVIEQSFAPEGVDPVARYLDEVILHGTPERVADEILRLKHEIGLDYLLCAPLSHQSFMLLTERVLPRLA